MVSERKPGANLPHPGGAAESLRLALAGRRGGHREGGASARQQRRARSGSRGVGTVFPSLSGTYAVTLVFSCSLLDVANDFSSSSLLILLCLLAAQSLI